mgnify:CR=1 FL=1|tara:strand:- start:9023 stop:9496 length:474 start_codon:yes stop_codon:yes gene_type:complete
MKKIVSTFLVIFIVFINKQSISIEKGKWSFVKDDDWCYIGSSPLKSDLPDTKKRGENYILVYKIIGSEENVIQIEAGYKYNLDKKINVKIDNANYEFYSTEDSSETAWTNDDKKVIYAMKKGLELTLTGESARGTTTNDVYTLRGFTNAVNQLNQDC